MAGRGHRVLRLALGAGRSPVGALPIRKMRLERNAFYCPVQTYPYKTNTMVERDHRVLRLALGAGRLPVGALPNLKMCLEGNAFYYPLRTYPHKPNTMAGKDHRVLRFIHFVVRRTQTNSTLPAGQIYRPHSGHLHGCLGIQFTFDPQDQNLPGCSAPAAQPRRLSRPHTPSGIPLPPQSSPAASSHPRPLPFRQSPRPSRRRFRRPD